MYIAVDFDGTCVTHAYPEIGKDIGAVPILKRIVERGHKLILLTMRSHPKNGQDSPNLKQQGLTPIPKTRDTLNEAIEWFRNNGVELYAVNENPSQYGWTNSKKVYANLYIDDAALGVPLKFDETGRGYVDWETVERVLELYGII